MQGQLWEFDVDFPVMTREQAEPWAAFFAALNSQEGSFYFGPCIGKAPRGVATGSPKVKGADQIGNDILTDGWTPGITGIIKKGDWLQIGNHLYKSLTDINSDGAGEATLTLFPKLRPSTADNAVIITSNPVGVFYLTTTPEWDTDVNRVFGIKFSATESL